MWTAVTIDEPMPIGAAASARPEPAAAGDVETLRRGLARRWGRAPSAIQIGTDLSSLALGLGDPGTNVVVAEPTDPALLAGVVSAGRRYVDAGRDHRFRIHPDGWRFATEHPRTGLAIVSAPNEPTQTVETPDLGSCVLLRDERYRADPLAPMGDGIVWRSFRLWCGAELEVLVNAPGEVPGTATPPTPEAVALVLDAADHPESFDARMARWSARVEAVAEQARQAGVVVIASGLAVWVRIPGTPSSRLTGDGALGSPHWTWRDGARLVPDAALEQTLERLMQEARHG